MYTIKIERGTRQWFGTLAVSIFVAVLIGLGKIPATVYQHWEGLLVGALGYHIVKMLNAPTYTDKPLVPLSEVPTTLPKEGA
jgi:uncharacterized membrane protein YccC